MEQRGAIVPEVILLHTYLLSGYIKRKILQKCPQQGPVVSKAFSLNGG